MTKHSITQKDWTAPKGHPQAGETFHMVVLAFNDGKEPDTVMLRYEFNRICDLEKETELRLGLSPRTDSAQHARAMACAFLRTAHAVTLEEAGDLLTRNPNAVLNAMARALVVAGLSEDEEEPKASAASAEATPDVPVEPAAAAGA